MIDLDEIEKALAAATPGPWEARIVEDLWDVTTPRGWLLDEGIPEDAALIALLRNAAPEMIAELRLLRARETWAGLIDMLDVEEAERKVAEAWEMHDHIDRRTEERVERAIESRYAARLVAALRKEAAERSRRGWTDTAGRMRDRERDRERRPAVTTKDTRQTLGEVATEAFTAALANGQPALVAAAEAVRARVRADLAAAVPPLTFDQDFEDCARAEVGALGASEQRDLFAGLAEARLRRAPPADRAEPKRDASEPVPCAAAPDAEKRDVVALVRRLRSFALNVRRDDEEAGKAPLAATSAIDACDAWLARWGTAAERDGKDGGR